MFIHNTVWTILQNQILSHSESQCGDEKMSGIKNKEIITNDLFNFGCGSPTT